jgi:hypothetical protein
LLAILFSVSTSITQVENRPCPFCFCFHFQMSSVHYKDVKTVKKNCKQFKYQKNCHQDLWNQPTWKWGHLLTFLVRHFKYLGVKKV